MLLLTAAVLGGSLLSARADDTYKIDPVLSSIAFKPMVAQIVVAVVLILVVGL